MVGKKMKELQRKKILKETGILLIATVMVLSTKAVTANTNNESPELMLAGADYISQSQQSNTFNPDWIHFDDGTNIQSIGHILGGTWEGAIRITPAELTGYDGSKLTAVRWHHGYTSEPPHSGNIKIYGTGTSTHPGGLITSEPFTVSSAGWFEINLSNPAPIDTSKDIWVSVQVTHAVGEHPLGVAPGPVVPGKGGWISTDGINWQQLGIDIPTLDYNWNIWAKVERSKPPEIPQRPEGLTEGLTGAEYTFSTTTTDPEGEHVYYLWDWGDETSSGWLGPFDSGEVAEASHSWTEAENYEIRVKAKDIYNHESDWSDSLKIFIVDVPILEISDISGSLVKVRAVIRNNGSADAVSVNWNITFDGGFILLGKKTTGKVITIPPGEEVTIISDPIFGIGKTVVRVTAEISGSSDAKEQEAFVLLFFIKM